MKYLLMCYATANSLSFTISIKNSNNLKQNNNNNQIRSHIHNNFNISLTPLTLESLNFLHQQHILIQQLHCHRLSL